MNYTEIKSILLVTGEDRVLTEFYSLRDLGYLLSTVSSVDNAILICKTTNINLLLFDMDLGIETAEFILKEFSIPILFLLNEVNPEIIKRVEDISPYGYVFKHSPLEMIHACIKMALRLHNCDKYNFTNAILDHAGALIVVLNHEGRIKRFNHAAEKLSGYSFKELEDKYPWDTFLPREDADTIRKYAFEALANSPEVLSGSYTNFWVSKKNERFLIDWNNTLLKDANGKLLFVISIGINITERIKSEIALKESETKYRMLHESMMDAIASVDMSGKIKDCNHSFLSMIGYSKSEVLSLTNNDLTPEKWHPIETDIIKSQVMVRGYSDVYEKEYRHKEGTLIPIELRTFLIRNEENEPSIMWAIIRNISKRKKDEAELIQAKELAEAASRAKSEFLANMSHEIRTPLNAVIGFTDMLVRSNLDSHQKQYMEIVYQSANSLLDLLNDILDFSKIEAGKLTLLIEKVNLLDLLKQSSNIIRIKLEEKNLKFTLNIPEYIPNIVWTDSIRLKQIIVNLLSNAAKFTEQGEIELKIELIDYLNASSEAEFLFAVRDTGIGISDDDKVKILKAFEQVDTSTNRKYGGTGLGLTISNKLLGLMNSKLDLESKPGKGSIFYFVLKMKAIFENITDEKIIRKEDNFETKDVTTISTSYNILVADDDSVNMFLTKTMIEAILPRANVLEAFNGKDAIKLFKTEKPDIIFMDIQMPEMDGLEATIEIRKIEVESRIPIIALSAGTKKGDKEKCIETGMDDYVSKPLVKDSIEKLLYKWLLKT